MESLSERLRMARERAHLSPIQASKLTGINYKTLNNYERGVSKPDVGKLSAICKAYQISADYFIQPEMEKSPTSFEAGDKDIFVDELMKNYKALNRDGRRKLIDYSKDLISSGRYTAIEEDAGY